MSIIRIKKKGDFSVISNKHLKDAKLSLKAKGLLTLLLSMPDDWKVYVKHLKTLSRDGEDAHYTAIKELVKTGYIVKEKCRNPKGRFAGTQYTIYENSIAPHPENPDTVIPDTENPGPENTELLNTDNTNTDFNKKTTTAIQPSKSSFSFDHLELKYDSPMIRKTINQFLKKKDVAYVEEAVAYANCKTRATDAHTFKAYLFKTLAHGYAEGFFASETSKNESPIINLDSVKAIQIDNQTLLIRDQTAINSDGEPVYAFGMINFLISRGKAIPIYERTD